MLNTEQILKDLKRERDRLTRAIDALQEENFAEVSEQQAVRNSVLAKNGRGRHHFTAEQRKRLSESMKKRWAERRRKKA